MEDTRTIKMAMIASATKALEFRRKNPAKSDDDALRHVISMADSLLHEITQSEAPKVIFR